MLSSFPLIAAIGCFDVGSEGTEALYWVVVSS